MDVDGEAKAQRKVSPLTFPFLLVVVIKEIIRKKGGGQGHLLFSDRADYCVSINHSVGYYIHL